MQLVNILNEYMIEEQGLTDILMDVLNIERKTAYRRISGQVPFSFMEVVTLANYFGFSLDEFSVSSEKQKVVFELGVFSEENNNNFHGEMYSFIKNTLQVFNEHYARICKLPNPVVTGAYNMLPPIFYLKYESLTKFSIMRWSHKFHSDNKFIYNFNDIVIPDKMRKEQLRLVSQYQKVQDTTLIINHLSFKNLILEIEYYYNMGVLTNENITAIKADLLAILQDMKDISSDYKSENKLSIDLYVSNIYFESSLICFESDKSANAVLTVFYINFITTKDKFMIETMKNWIHTLKRSSTLISGASDAYKYRFFSQQEELINQLGN